MSVLCYVRPWNIGQFSRIAKETFPDDDVILISEHLKCDQSGFANQYKNEILQKKEGRPFDLLSREELLDLTLRCRLLRDLPEREALNHLNLAGLAILDALDSYQPSHVLSLTVDSFIIDLLRILCKKRKVVFIGLIPSFVNGYFRISARGEHSPSFPPMGCDANTVADLLVSNYQPSFNAPSIRQPVRMALLRWLGSWARYILFSLLRLHPEYRYNYHYWSSALVSQRNLNLFPRIRYGADDWLEKLKLTNKLRIFIPLQMFPECTVDYWCPDLDSIQYYGYLKKLISKLSESFVIVIKEHPSVLGNRPAGFYRELQMDENCVIAPTHLHSDQVVQVSNAVLVWTGTVGFQAALQGKRVLTVGEPYYLCGKMFKSIDLNTSIADIIEFASKEDTADELSNQNTLLLENLTSMLLLGNFKNNGTWSETNRIDCNDASAMASSLRAVLRL